MRPHGSPDTMYRGSGNFGKLLETLLARAIPLGDCDRAPEFGRFFDEGKLSIRIIPQEWGNTPQAKAFYTRGELIDRYGRGRANSQNHKPAFITSMIKSRYRAPYTLGLLAYDVGSSSVGYVR